LNALLNLKLLNLTLSNPGLLHPTVPIPTVPNRSPQPEQVAARGAPAVDRSEMPTRDAAGRRPQSCADDPQFC
jgi:hypothetical protein